MQRANAHIREPANLHQQASFLGVYLRNVRKQQQRNKHDKHTHTNEPRCHYIKIVSIWIILGRVAFRTYVMLSCAYAAKYATQFCSWNMQNMLTNWNLCRAVCLHALELCCCVAYKHTAKQTLEIEHKRDGRWCFIVQKRQQQKCTTTTLPPASQQLFFRRKLNCWKATAKNRTNMSEAI